MIESWDKDAPFDDTDKKDISSSDFVGVENSAILKYFTIRINWIVSSSNLIDWKTNKKN